MSATSKIHSSLQITFKTGQDANGKDVVKNQKFSGVKVTALDDDLFIVGAAIGTLMDYPVVSILRLDDSLIVNE